MVKAKPALKQNPASKQFVKSTKEGFIHKNKNQKFKQTPMGKIALINGSKAENNANNKGQKVFQKGKNNSPQKSPKGKQQFPQKNSPKGGKNQGQKKQVGPKQMKKQEEDESDEDINEGVVPQEELSFTNEDSSTENEESDEDVPNIFGASLAENSDDDDDDFVQDDDDTTEKNKGVKMFKGVLTKKAGKKGASADADVSGSDVNTSASFSKSDTGSDDDDDEEEEEEDEESDEEAEEPGLHALLGNSIADEDDDDEDFDEEEEDDEDDDISEEDEEEGEDEKTTPDKKKGGKKQQEPEKEHFKGDKNTIFIGNVPVHVTKQQLGKLFGKFGKIENIHIRGIIPEKPGIPKEEAAKANKVHPKQKAVIAFVKFQSVDSVSAALSLNGEIFEGNYLRVDRSELEERKPDANKSVFVGNLNFRIDNNALWKHFEGCGKIESVRIVRDNKSGVGKGFGFVNFTTEDSVALALELNGTELMSREIRVKKYTNEEKPKSKQRHGNKRSHSRESAHKGSPKKLKSNSESPVAVTKKNKKNEQKGKKNNSPQSNGSFQGQKADISKKKKVNKLEKKKKVMAAKLAAKPKKPIK